MRKLVGTVYYLMAIIALLVAIGHLDDRRGTELVVIAGFAGAVWSAFFGVMCFAADEAIALLRQIAGHAPDRGAASSSSISDATGPQTQAEGPPTTGPNITSNQALAMYGGLVILLILIGLLWR